MLTLIKNDPRKALAHAVSFSEYAQLPEEVRAYVERPFSARAELLALPVCSSEPGKLGVSQTISHELATEGKNYTASVYGRRLQLDSKEAAPLQGITLGGLAAVREEVFQLVESADAKGFPMAQAEGGHCFATGLELGPGAVTALAGGMQFRFADAEVLAEFDSRIAALDLVPGPHTGTQVVFLMADGDDPGEGFDWPAAEDEVDLQASSWTENPKDVYFIRVDFPDVTGASIGQATLADTLNTTVSDTIFAMSYGKTSINATVSPVVVRMPNSAASYESTDDNDGLHDDAKTAAEAAIPGLNLDDYDIVGVHFASVGMGTSANGYAGLAGGSRQWIQGTGSSNVIIHEFGHNYGIGHSSFWNTTDGSVVGTGASIEYGDDFDIMGGGSNAAHFHPQAKERLDWLEPAQWTDVTSAGSGTYRVYQFDDANTTGGTRGLRITKAASPSEYYWLGYRRNLPENQWLQSGAYLLWERPNNNRSWLLDTTPGSADGRDDGMIVPGKTYSDSAADVHITTLSTGGSAPDEWIDVQVNLGSFSNNYAPTATLSGPTTANARESVTFSVSGNDTDGDTLAYYWDFGDSTVATNSASQTRSWSVGGSYTISVTVSDMKGGTVTKTMAVAVSDPLDNWTQRTSGTGADLFDIATDGTRLVAVGGGSGTYRTSTDGTTWSGGTIGINIFLRGVIWDGAQFLVAGQNYSFGAGDWRGVVYTSPDGSSWTERHYDGEELNDIAAGGGVYVAVGDGGTIWRSTNGTSWSPIPSGTTTNLNGVSYGDGKFVAVGALGNGGGGVVLTSTDGSSWTDTSSGAGLASWQGFYDVEYCNDLFLASGWYTKIRYSKDSGSNFPTMRSINEQVPGFAYGNGIYLAAGKDTTDFSVSYVQNLISIDGETWTQLTTNQSQEERTGAVFFEDTFVTVAENGQIWQSDTFTAPPGSSAFATWLAGYFPGSTPAVEGLLDPDGDGVKSLEEFVAGTDPTNASSVDPIQIEEIGGYLQLTIIKDPAATGVDVSVELSTDMVNWGTMGTVIVTDNASSLVVRSALLLSDPGALREFMRAAYTLVE